MDFLEVPSVCIPPPITTTPSPKPDIEYRLETLDCGIQLHRVLGNDATSMLDALGHMAGLTKQRPRKPGSTAFTASYSFPGPNPISLERADIPKLRAQPYHITEKTDGVRMLLFAFEYRNVHMIVVLDRTLTPYIFPIHRMPRALYQGTLFDGELVYDSIDKTWVYLIFDATNIAGVPVFQMPFSHRMEAVRKSLSFYVPTPTDAGVLRPKTFLPFQADVRPFRSHVQDMEARYKTDGVIFMPENDAVLYGKHQTLLKLKQTHSVDFLVRNGKLWIYDETTRRNKTIGVATGPNAHLAVERCIVECVLDPSASLQKPDKWHVLTVRNDKNTSNNKFTLSKTLLNIQESLTFVGVTQSVFDVSTTGQPGWE